MDIVQNIDRGTIIECRHCNGIGVCQRSVREDAGVRDTVILQVRSCDRCGRGIIVKSLSDLRPPACKVCNGVGSVRI